MRSKVVVAARITREDRTLLRRAAKKSKLTTSRLLEKIIREYLGGKNDL